MELLFNLAQSAPKTVTQIRWDGAPEAWVVFLVFALIVAFAAACYLLEGRGGNRGWLKMPLTALRALIVIIAVCLLFRPFRAEEQREVKNGFVVLAIDTSRSMGFEDRERNEELRESIAKSLGVTTDRLRKLDRLERVKTALRADGAKVLHSLAKKNRVRIFTFDSTRKRLTDIEKADESGEVGAAKPDIGRSMAELDGIAAEGKSTALGDSLQRILTDLRSDRVAAVILLTDGRSNGGSLTPVTVAGRFKRKSVPIFAVGVGDPDPPRDLSIDDFRAPDVSLAGDILHGSCLVRAQGYTEPKQVRVRIKLGDLQVAEEIGEVGGDRTEWEVNFSTKVMRPGEYTLEAIIEPDPDELTADNNRAMRRIRVIDERIRVLYLEAYPRWEYRFLKNALIRDRHMHVQCLNFAFDPGTVQESSPGIKPLTRLPSREELLKYHVIILGDIKPQANDRQGNKVFWDGALETIKELVKERGGGLLMISGEQAAPRLYAKTPIADLLPIVIDESTATIGDFTRSWRPRLTREGRQSPMLRLEPGEEANRELWDSKLRGFYWHAPVARGKPQAHVLAVHPRDRNTHGNLPLFAWQRYGSGTCFWLGIDETWRWRAEIGDKYPYKFYGQIIRFLSLQSFTRSKRFYVTSDKTHYDVGEEVRIRAEIRDPEALTADGAIAQQDILLDSPDGTTQTLNLKGIDGEAGKYQGVFKPVQTGPYRLYVEPGERFGADEVASRVFEVKLPRLELQEPRMDKDGLERIATASGGRFMRLDELSKLATGDAISSLEEPILVGRTETELWDRPWVFGLFFLVVLLEWIGRKFARML